MYTTVYICLPYILATQWVHDVESLVKGIGTCLVGGIYQGYIVNIWDIWCQDFASGKVLLRSTLGPSFSRLFNRTINGCFPAGWFNGKSIYKWMITRCTPMTSDTVKLWSCTKVSHEAIGFHRFPSVSIRPTAIWPDRRRRFDVLTKLTWETPGFLSMGHTKYVK